MDGLIGVKVEAALKRIAIRLMQKWKEPYSRACGYMKSIVVITLVRSTYRFIQGVRVPESHISMTRPQWKEGAGLHLFW